jgi:1-acyl-sn-glycerol-3-phosphate acyltransferase
MWAPACTLLTLAQFARLINVVPIDPDVQLLRAMRAGAAGLRAGKILNIYPEGHQNSCWLAYICLKD